MPSAEDSSTVAKSVQDLRFSDINHEQGYESHLKDKIIRLPQTDLLADADCTASPEALRACLQSRKNSFVLYVATHHNEGKHLSPDAARGLFNILWFVRLDLGHNRGGGSTQNIYVDDNGNAVIIDCEDKGETPIHAMKKLAARCQWYKNGQSNSELLEKYETEWWVMYRRYVVASVLETFVNCTDPKIAKGRESFKNMVIEQIKKQEPSSKHGALHGALQRWLNVIKPVSPEFLRALSSGSFPLFPNQDSEVFKTLLAWATAGAEHGNQDVFNVFGGDFLHWESKPFFLRKEDVDAYMGFLEAWLPHWAEEVPTVEAVAVVANDTPV